MGDRAPAGQVNVYQYVVAITPNVSGEVVDVPVEGLKRLRKGDVLFQIDREPYQAVVDQLTATLEDTKQNVERLKNAVVIAQTVVTKTNQQIEIATSQQTAASAALTAAEAASRQAKTEREKALGLERDMETQVAAAEREFNRIKDLVERKVETKSALDRAEVQFTSLKSQQATARLNVTVAVDGVAASDAKVKAAESEFRTSQLMMEQLVKSESPRARASLRDAELAAGSLVGEEHTSIATAKAKLHKAQFDLKETTVCAPSDGWAVGVTLRPGQRVTNMPFKGSMTFVDAEQTRLVIGVSQFAMRHIKPGDGVEVSLKLYPGQILTGEVEKIAWVTPEGQLSPSGSVAAAPSAAISNRPFGVVVKLEENNSVDVTSLPGGAVGTAAVFTDQAKATHVIRRVMLRMNAWINFVNPF